MCQPLLVDNISTLEFLYRVPTILELAFPFERTFRASALTIPVDLTVLSAEELLLLLLVPLPEFELVEEVLMYSPLTKPVVLLYLILYHPFDISRIDTLVL